MPSPQGALIIGGNAQGKTTFLEAICVLLRLRSPRTTKLHELVRHGGPGFRIDGRCQDHELAVIYTPAEKRLLLDGAPPASTGEYLRAGLVTWIANDDLRILHEGGEARRAFMDFVCSQVFPDYGRALRTYQQALRQRNALLRNPEVDWSALASFDIPLSTAGDALRGMRREGMSMIEPLARAISHRLGGGDEELTLGYADNAGAPLIEHFNHGRREDARLRTTTRGPHRDSLKVSLNGIPAEAFASEGQQRSIVLALKLAQFDLIRTSRGVAPILLVDDVFGELDPVRRAAFIDALPHSQRFLTTTSLRWLEGLDLALPRFGMNSGALTPLD